MKTIILFLLVGLVNVPANACTTIELKSEDSFVHATNADFVPLKKAIFINRRGIWKDAARFGSTGPQAHWFAKYGSLTDTFYSREFALGGINEAGLTVHMHQGMSTFNESSTKPKIQIRQTVQYLLDTSANIDEAIENFRKVAPYKKTLSVHWWICEASGQCAAIDFDKGELRAYRGGDLKLPVFTNTPYNEALGLYNQCLKDQCQKDLPKMSNDSKGRFIKAGYLTSQFKGQDLLNGALNILEVDRQKEEMFTLWQVVYRQSLKDNKKEIFFVPEAGAEKQWIDMAELDFSCKHPAVFQPITAESGAGNIVSKFRPYDKAFNQEMTQALADAGLISANDTAEMARYPETLQNCQDVR